MDVVDLLRDRTALLSVADGQDLDATELISYLSASASKKLNVGASIRWSIAVSSDSQPQ